MSITDTPPFYPLGLDPSEGELAWDPSPEAAVSLSPVSTADRTQNILRPETFDQVVGQVKAKRMMKRMVDAANDRMVPLDHVLLVAGSGLGKSTFSHVIAHELDVQVYEVEAPVDLDTLIELGNVMNDGDILRIEEIHQQAIADRRARSSNTNPEVLYSIMEDRTITTGGGVYAYPHITVIGTTTDEGLLPDPFINRFPIRPRLEAYSVKDMELIADMNARRLGLTLTPQARKRFAAASRNTPRQVNNYMRNAASLVDLSTMKVTSQLALEVLRDLNGVTDDGLSPDMQAMLCFLYTRAKRVNAAGEIRYQASVNTIATAIGKSRDSKAIALRVEPFLIDKGYIQVAHAGRILTDAGVKRAKTLSRRKP